MHPKIPLDAGTAQALISVGKPACVFMDKRNNHALTQALAFELNMVGFPCVFVDDMDDGRVTGISVVAFGGDTLISRMPVLESAYYRTACRVSVVADLLKGAYHNDRASNQRLLARYVTAKREAALPQWCSKCNTRHPAADMIRKKKCENSYYWLCRSCDVELKGSKGRDRRPTPPEWDAINAAVASRHRYIREYKIEGTPFFYDLCFPELQLIIEVDSATWHSTERQKKKDRIKAALAVSRGFKLVRVRSPDVFGQVQAAVDIATTRKSD